MNKLVYLVMLSTVVSATAICDVVAASGDESVSESLPRVTYSTPNSYVDHQIKARLITTEAVAITPTLDDSKPSFAAAYVLKSKSDGSIQMVRHIYDATRKDVFAENVLPRPAGEVGEQQSSPKSPNRFDTTMANVRAWIQDQKDAVGQAMEDVPSQAKAQFVSGFQSLRGAISNFFSI